PDFDEMLGQVGSEEVVVARVAATNRDPEAFLRLLAGACARPEDSLALALLDSVPANTRVPVSRHMVRHLADGFAKSPSPTARLLARLTDDAGTLDLLAHKNSSEQGVEAMVNTICSS